MKSLIIEEVRETPSVDLIGNEGYFSFAGKSYPENVNTFYNPVIKYLEVYTQNPQEKTVLNFNWLYYNSATSHIIVKIIQLSKRVTQHGKQCVINWCCKADDDLMLQKGEELKGILDIEFNILFI